MATLVAAAAYGVTAPLLGFGYGFAAAGVGVIVGLPMGLLGRGISTKFSVAAGTYTIVGCLLGNVVRAVIEMPKVNSGSVADTLQYYPVSEIVERAVSYLSLGDLIYWLVAVFCAVFLARRPLSRSERLAIGVFQRDARQ